MSLSPPEEIGPLRRERLRTARLYFVCEARPPGSDLEVLLNAALGGGADMLELRDKEAERRAVERAAGTFRRLGDTYSALFILNDDPDLAHSCDADGVHLGQDDDAPASARELLGQDAIIGLSTHDEDQIRAAQEEPVDYISVGPIWETPTKQGRPATGLELISFAAQESRLPFFAIGGITPENAPEVVAAGAHRLCVVRAIRDAGDPGAAAASLRRALGSQDPRLAAPGG